MDGESNGENIGENETIPLRRRRDYERVRQWKISMAALLQPTALHSTTSKPLFDARLKAFIWLWLILREFWRPAVRVRARR